MNGEPWEQDPAVAAVASRLGLRGPSPRADEIAKVVIETLDRWMHEHRLEPTTLEDLHFAVSQRARLDVRHIVTDADIPVVAKEVEEAWPTADVQLPLEFDGDTEALVFRDSRSDVHVRYHAVIDARGPARKARAWFAGWHEPMHPLLEDDANARLWRRTRRDRPEPIERLIDFVAGRVAFWGPIIDPVLIPALRGARGKGILDAFESARAHLAPEASMECSIRAFIRRVEHPAVVVWCREGTRKSEAALGSNAPSWDLRVQTLIENDLATAHGLRIPPNFRVPPGSVIRETCTRGGTEVQDGRLSEWRSKDGDALPDLPVRVTTNGAWAIIELRG